MPALARPSRHSLGHGGSTSADDVARPGLVRGLRWTAGISGWVAAGVGLVVLVGWTAGIETLKSGCPGLLPMNPVTALCFAACGASVWLLRAEPVPTARRRLAQALAAAVVVVGVARTANAAIPSAPAPDLLLFGDPIRAAEDAGTTAAGRMAPLTGGLFAILGTALVLLDVRGLPRHRSLRLGQLLTLVAGFGSLLAIAGYGYSALSLRGIAVFKSMALITALTFLALSLGTLFLRPDRGLMAMLASRNPAGVMARRLVPAAVILPLLAGALRQVGEAQGYFSATFGDALLVTLCGLVFTALAWWHLSVLDRFDTLRGRTEDGLRQAEAVYHSLVETLPQNIFRKDLDGHFSFGNRNFCNTLGRSLKEVSGKTDFDFFPEPLAARYRNDDREVIDTGRTLDVVEEHVKPDGDKLYVQVIKTPVYDGDGEPIGIQGIFWDVTARKVAEEGLRKSREQFDLAVRGSRDGLWDWDLRTNEVYFSPRWKEMIGHAEGELPNRFNEWEDRIHPEDRARAMSTIQAYFEGRLPVYELEHRLRHKDGSYRWILARGEALRDDSGKPYRMAGSHTDITRRKGAEEQMHRQNQLLEQAARSEREALDALRVAHEALKTTQSRLVQSEKLVGLGQMVAGVAHEINNPLAFVNNNVAVLQRDVATLAAMLELYRRGDEALAAARPDLMAELREMADAVDLDYTLENLKELTARSRDGLRRIQQIVKDLRDFARLDESDLNEVDVNAGIESTINIIAGHAKKKRVTIERDLSPALPRVTCFPAKVNQVVMNLISNAIDASREGGKVTVRTYAAGSGAGPRDSSSPGQNGVAGDEGSVRIEVIDEGTGIDPAVRERIFDPFFTTKPQGQGTGLGLSISYGIVRDHGGGIEVDSVPGRGSTFTVTLPVHAHPPGSRDSKVAVVGAGGR